MDEVLKKGFSGLTLGLSIAGTALVTGTTGFFIGRANGRKGMKELTERIDRLENRTYRQQTT